MTRSHRSTALAALATALSIAVAGPPARSADTLEPGRPDTWKLPEPDLYAVSARGDLVWAVGYWGSVLLSTDGGETWSHQPTPTRETLYGVSFADARHGWAVGATGTLLHSTDGGASWDAQSARLRDEFGEERPLDVHLFGVSAVSPTDAWAVGDLGVVLHTVDGTRWDQVRIPEEAFADDNFPDRILNAVVFSDAEHGWIAGEFGTTLRTEDGGATWRGERTLVDTPNDIYLYALSALDGQRAAVSGLAGTVLVTEDGGTTWMPRRTGSSAGMFSVAVSPRHVTVVGDRGEIFTWSEGADGWVSGERPHLFNWLAGITGAGAGRLFAVGEKGLILRSEDAGASWSQVAGAEPPPFAGVSVPPDPGGRVLPPRNGEPAGAETEPRP